MIISTDLYENIKNNKIYLNINESKFDQSMHDKYNKDNETKESTNKENENINKIFNNISLKTLKRKSFDNINTFYEMNNSVNTSSVNTSSVNTSSVNTSSVNTSSVNTSSVNIVTQRSSYKYKNDSFMTELSQLLFKETRELKNEIKDYVNSQSNIEYLKSINRSYKKFRIDIHNILLNKDIDKLLTDNLLIIICKVFEINIIFVNNSSKIYKLYENNNKLREYYIFNKYINTSNSASSSYTINYEYNKVINVEELDKFLKNKKLYITIKELKNMKISELKEFANTCNINSNQKKQELIDELSSLFNKFIK